MHGNRRPKTKACIRYHIYTRHNPWHQWAPLKPKEETQPNERNRVEDDHQLHSPNVVKTPTKLKEALNTK